MCYRHFAAVSSSLPSVFQQGMRGCLSQVLQAQPTQLKEKCHSSSVLSLKVPMWIALSAISGIKSRAHAGEWLLSFKALALFVRSSTPYSLSRYGINTLKSVEIPLFLQPEAGEIQAFF